MDTFNIMNMSRRKFVFLLGGALFMLGGKKLEKVLALNQTKENIKKEINPDIRFAVVGDPHIKIGEITDRGNERLKEIVKFLNNIPDIDFVIGVGDMADHGLDLEFKISKNILDELKKPYYILAGNHDVFLSPNIFEKYYGPMEHIEVINGYQFIFVGIRQEKIGKKIKKLDWSFDFSKADKNLPTIILNHGPVVDPPPDCIYYNLKKDILSYAKSMKSEIDQFTNIIAVISGHIHFDSDQKIGLIRHITINGLISYAIEDIIPIIEPSDKIAIATLKDNKLYYNLINYRRVDEML